MSVTNLQRILKWVIDCVNHVKKGKRSIVLTLVFSREGETVLVQRYMGQPEGRMEE